MPIKSINTCKTKIAHWALQNSELQSHISDAYLKEKINDTTPTCPLNDFLHTRQSFLRATVNTEAVLAVHSRETRNFSRDSSRFLRDESRFSRYESRFSRYKSRFSREGGNLHLSGAVCAIFLFTEWPREVSKGHGGCHWCFICAILGSCQSNSHWLKTQIDRYM